MGMRTFGDLRPPAISGVLVTEEFLNRSSENYLPEGLLLVYFAEFENFPFI